jgi:hypothetical protein
MFIYANQIIFIMCQDFYQNYEILEINKDVKMRKM